ncbi:MAG: hypothetical protein QOH78_1243 [Verrucomicrobiota bacterium]
MTGLILLVSFIAIVAWGSAYFALRDPPAISRMKIVFTCVLLLGILVAMAGLRWTTGEEDLSGVTLLIWPMAAIASVACLCSVLGALIGIDRRRNRP